MGPQVNCNSTPSSVFLQHLFAYPIISDSVDALMSTSYGAKSLDLTAQGYEMFGKPLASKLAGPYGYVSPYVKKADSIGDTTLSNIDNRFPVLKKQTGELVEDGKSIIFFPLRKGHEGKDHLLSTYMGEIQKVGGDGIATYAQAGLGTTIIIVRDTLGWLRGFLPQKKAKN
ncbi:hypothetical protein BJ875DRAFT_442917 [Amylocarpus encephaloides]|uniref:Uncharacterized protein n=1 Tax=Amylocarpus encephaloides TaxID=45428 RepID=A0A9P8C410_9HELO|nr:hypothetical protein BJ875DRAFT_442917 [Amylocarpus encephaloides]